MTNEIILMSSLFVSQCSAMFLLLAAHFSSPLLFHALRSLPSLLASPSKCWYSPRFIPLINFCSASKTCRLCLCSPTLLCSYLYSVILHWVWLPLRRYTGLISSQGSTLCFALSYLTRTTGPHIQCWIVPCTLYYKYPQCALDQGNVGCMCGCREVQSSDH